MNWIELPPSGRRRGGPAQYEVTLQRRRLFDASIIALVAVFAVAWIAAVVQAVTTDGPRPGLATRMTSNPLSADAPPPAPYLLDAAVRQLMERSQFRGRSGQVRVLLQEPDSGAAH